MLYATKPEAVIVIDDRLAEPGAALISFLNAHVSNLASRTPALKAILNQSIVLNDGIGVSLASRLLHGANFPDNLQGTNFTPQFLHDTRHQFRIFTIGSAPGVAQRACRNLQKQAPRHDYVGAVDGFSGIKNVPALLNRIRSSGANLVLVGMGSPKQEIWAHQHIVGELGVSAFCVGGFLDFISGEKPRAPLWVQKLRCEWIFRLIVEPSRLWRRYLIGNPQFMARLVRAVRQARQA